jgi:hypothetical protein
VTKKENVSVKRMTRRLFVSAIVFGVIAEVSFAYCKKWIATA